MKPLIFYPRTVLGKNAVTVFPGIWIRRDRKDDTALHAHERRHYTAQAIAVLVQLDVAFALFGLHWWLLLLVFPWSWGALYLLPSFRFWAEVRGMRAQIDATDESFRPALTARLAYNLFIAYETSRSRDECMAALTESTTTEGTP